MLRLSKKVEYGIMAMQYLASNPGQKFTAKQIAADLNLSYDFLAKTLQKLMKKDLVESQQGIKGGYYLAKPAEEINMMEIVDSLDSKPELVDCLSEDPGRECSRVGTCLLHNPMKIIQEKVENVFKETMLEDLATQNFVEIENLNTEV